MQPIKLVAGNKCDLKDCRVVSSRQGLEYARSRGCGFMETSAREMVNIEETFAREGSLLFSSFSMSGMANEDGVGMAQWSLILNSFSYCVG